MTEGNGALTGLPVEEGSGSRESLSRMHSPVADGSRAITKEPSALRRFQARNRARRAARGNYSRFVYFVARLPLPGFDEHQARSLAQDADFGIFALSVFSLVVLGPISLPLALARSAYQVSGRAFDRIWYGADS